ncbi:unnamed protein product [Linum trigynum]|uniref:Uncharacterized protein n=1 Tax=Linum trigynum TaxID=586398 RepID=A0AAV2ESF1_9ROSI
MFDPHRCHGVLRDTAHLPGMLAEVPGFFPPTISPKVVTLEGVRRHKKRTSLPGKTISGYKDKARSWNKWRSQMMQARSW